MDNLFKKLGAALEILGENWWPESEDGAFEPLSKCRSPREAAYVLGVAYYIEKEIGIRVILRGGAAFEQTGVWFVEPRWKGIGVPSHLLIVPHYGDRHGRPHDFGIFYGDEAYDDEGVERPRWKLAYSLNILDKGGALRIAGRYESVNVAQSDARTWFRWIVAAERV